MEEARLEQLYKDFVMSPELRALEKLIASPNIFDVFNISHYEIRHSNFLSWLLNPKGNHGLGHRVLLDFLREMALDERAKGLSIINLASMPFDNVQVRREWHSIDILIELQDLIVVVENKIDAGETNDQLKRYKLLIESHFPNRTVVFVYLTPSGMEASEAQTWVSISYNVLIRILEDLLKAEEDSLSSKVHFYLNDYISTLKNDIMSNGEIADMARKIYKGHQELFDIIIEHKPDAAAEFKDILQAKAAKRGYEIGSPNKGYLRVLTKQLHALIPRGVHRNWPQGEAFTFEIDFLWAKGYARIYCNIPPGDESFRSYLNKIFEGLDEYKKPSGGIWLTYFHKRLDFNIKKVMEDDPEKAEQKADLILDELDKLVAKVEPAILAHSDELRAIIEKRM